MLTGGCFCRAVRYEAAGGTFHSTLCHCSDCRHVAGAPAVAWFSITVSGFRVTSGTMRRFHSSAKAVRGFCGDCGTALTYQHADFAEEIDVTSASLDAPEAMPPADHTWICERLDWMKVAAGLPAYERGRE